MAPASDLHPPIVAPLGDTTTERLELRRFRAEDLEGLAKVFTKPEVWKYPFGRGFNRAETQKFLDVRKAEWESCGFGCWLATERGTARIVGYVGISVPTFLPEILPAIEVGWRLDPDVWGKGYATEGASAALDEAFTTLGLSEVFCVIEPANTASVRVAERLGMRLVRAIVVPASDGLEQVDATLFGINQSDWLARR